MLGTAALTVAGCGDGHQVPDLAGLPLAGGSHVVLQTKICNPGANAYCADELVVTNPAFQTSADFLDAERAILHRLGWSGQYAPNGNEHSDDSPGHKLRVIFATAQGDLVGIDLGWIKRSRSVGLALSRAMFKRQSALSMLLLKGSA